MNLCARQGANSCSGIKTARASEARTQAVIYTSRFTPRVSYNIYIYTNTCYMHMSMYMC